MMSRTIRLALVSVIGGTLVAGTALASSATQQPEQRKTRPLGAQEAMLAAFDRYEVVGGMSPSHGIKDVDDFLLALIRNPKFPRKVDDIAIECGNARYQRTLDRYIAGGNVPVAEVRQVWRNTTGPNCGFSTFYEQLIPLVRQINTRLAPKDKLRVLACDPPIDWAKVKKPEDTRPFEDRETHIASIMKKEVLSKHRKALMLFGVFHMLHGPEIEIDSAVELYERDYPNTTFVISEHRRFLKENDKLEKRMAGWPVASLVRTKGTWLARVPSSYFPFTAEPPPAGSRGFIGVDGYLWLGPSERLLQQAMPVRTIVDKAYLAELRRRAAVTKAPPDAWPDALIRRHAESSVLIFPRS